jgi:hypothetical protein
MVAAAAASDPVAYLNKVLLMARKEASGNLILVGIVRRHRPHSLEMPLRQDRGHQSHLRIQEWLPLWSFQDKLVRAGRERDTRAAAKTNDVSLLEVTERPCAQLAAEAQAPTVSTP